VKKVVISILTMFTLSHAIDGKDVYNQKCKSCHIEYIAMSKLKENFLQEDNKQLKLKAPTINQITFRLKSRIGDPRGDQDIHKMEIDSFVADYISHPDKEKSICLPDVIKHFKTMPVVKLDDDELEAINDFLYEYDKYDYIKQKIKYADLSSAYELAKIENKIVMVKLTAKHCHFCKKMDTEVMVEKEVVLALKKDFVSVEIDVDSETLPFSLKRSMTPTFIFVSNDKKILKKIPGAWGKDDFLDILKNIIKLKDKN
jgi:thioredoxin-related protein